LRDDGADGGATGVEDFVPFLVEEGGGFWNSALDAAVARGVEAGGEDVLDGECDVRGVLGGFDNGGVTSSDGADERAEEELQGEVVGPDAVKERIEGMGVGGWRTR